MTTTTPEQTTAAPTTPAGGDEVIVARAGRYYRNTRYVFVLAMLVFAAYFAYDGWVAWPREAQMHRENPKTGKPHSDMDIWFQKVLACTLPPLALGFLGWTLYRSRGAYRLAGDVLSVPGHPVIPLEAIRQMDKGDWERKGIARVEYEHEGGKAAWLTLDDFIYDRPPTDRIVYRIETYLAAAAPPPAADEQPVA
jgi:hypothetical protein